MDTIENLDLKSFYIIFEPFMYIKYCLRKLICVLHCKTVYCKTFKKKMAIIFKHFISINIKSQLHFQFQLFSLSLLTELKLLVHLRKTGLINIHFIIFFLLF